MFRFFERILNLIGNFFNEMVNDAEWNKPEAVLEDALDKKRKNLEKFFEAIARLDLLKNDQVKDLKKKQIQLEQIEDQIIKAAKAGDRSKGVALMMKKNQLARCIENDVTTVNRRLDDLVRAKSKLKDAQEEIRGLESKKHEIVAEIKMLQAEKKVDQIQTRLFGNDSYKTLDIITKKIEIEKNKRDLVIELNGPEYTDDSDYIEAENEYDRIFKGKVLTQAAIGFSENKGCLVYESKGTESESLK